ncbi:MAG TPA: hypothetical protein G4O08_02760 [Anaerolineae bacterium]|nr:hypothetical protein [Anaerolineae bacterium]
MPRAKIYRSISLICLAVLSLSACGTPSTTTPPPQTSPPTENRCGDGVCDGPENTQNCPQDCPATVDTPPTSEVCQLPNPQHAVISEDLEVFRDILTDGSFESGEQGIAISSHSTLPLTLAEVSRSQDAARSGSWGYELHAGPSQGALFSVQAYVDKGETIRFSFWARSLNGVVSVQPVVLWDPDEPMAGTPPRQNAVEVGSDWTRISLVTDTKSSLSGTILWGLEVGPNADLYIDDASVEIPFWAMAPSGTDTRIVGGIPVPLEPTAPVHFTFVIHIEDPNTLQTAEDYFQKQTAIMRELARIMHTHGGFLTIQPEQDWAQGAEAGFHPGLLAELARDYGVVYSTHTHGPNCIDPQGVPRSASDCNSNPDWDSNTDVDDEVEYVRNLRDVLSDASGTSVTDHNGNFDFPHADRFSEIPMLTWSVYKNFNYQRTYDLLINNPWRPGLGNANEDVENFLTHHPDTPIVYIPGWGQAITSHPDRLLERLQPMLSQFIHYADPDRVNTFYAITHVGHYYSRTGDPNYLVYDPNSGEVIHSAEFEQHLQYWDDLLTALVDPLVEQGYLEWTSLPEMGELYLAWEAACAAQAPGP